MADQSGADDDRRQWARATGRRMAAALEGAAAGGGPLYSPAECEALAYLLFDLPTGTPTGGMRPQAIILEQMLRFQALEPTTAHILAQAVPRLDFERLLVSSSVAADLLGISMVSLGRHRRAGSFIADLVHADGRTTTAIAYRLERVLRVLATDRHRTALSGPGNIRFDR